MIKELFLRQFPEYNTDNFEITVNHSQRFSNTGGDIIVKKECTDFPGYYNYTYYWYEKDKQGNVTFEKEEDFNTLSVRISIGGEYLERIYLHSKETSEIDYSEREDVALKAFIKEKEQEIRKDLSNKILSGEIDLNFYVSDSDSYECPPSKIKNRIIKL